MLDLEYLSLIIGALYHDIGKFWQRAEKDNQELIKNIKEEFNLKIKGLPEHQFWSAYFLKNILKVEEAAKIAKNHHNPVDPFDYITAIADKLSGEEREDREGAERADPSMEPLISIFSQVKKKDMQKPATFYQPLTGEVLEAKTIFPKEKKEDAFIEKNYLSLWKDFENAIKSTNLDVSNEKKLARLYHLLELFTISIPSAAYYSIADISLFDHLKTTTAITACLYQYSRRKGMLDFERIHSELIAKYKTQSINPSNILNIQAFTLLGGDISGIQGFIYDISSKGAAKGLKGRSLYLSLISEVISKHIVRAFSIPYTNILFCGGGHFYLILPLLDEREIKELQKKINNVFYEAHKGSFSLIIADTSLSFKDFSGEEFGARWVEMVKKIQPKKKNKFIEIIQEKPTNFFGPFELPEKLCEVCRAREAVKEAKCGFCESFEELGEKVIKNKFLIETKISESPLKQYNNVSEVFNAFGFEIDFTDSIEDSAINYMINERKFWITNSDGFLLLPNHTPFENDKIIDFDHLSDKANGKKRWGVLRGDVDNLGFIFKEGIENRSISRITSLSRNLNLYFTFWLNKICNQNYFKNKTYVIYAGGDDFFIVGSWDVLPELAIFINNDFRKFTASNPYITLSSAVFIAPTKKYPLYKAAEVCGTHLEEKAKSQKNKNSIAFLGKAFEWDELKKVHDLKEAIIDLIKNKKVSNAIIQAIYSGFAEFFEYQKGKYPIHRVWRLIYSLSRLAKRYNAENIIQNIEQKLITDNYNLELGGLYAAHWAELEI